MVIVKTDNERAITKKRRSCSFVTDVARDHLCRWTERLSAISRVGDGDRTSVLICAIPYSCCWHNIYLIRLGDDHRVIVITAEAKGCLRPGTPTVTRSTLESP